MLKTVFEKFQKVFKQFFFKVMKVFKNVCEKVWKSFKFSKKNFKWNKWKQSKKSRKIEIKKKSKDIKNERFSYLIFAWIFSGILNISIEFFHRNNSRVIIRTPVSDMMVCVVFQSRNYFNIDNTKIISIYFDKYWYSDDETDNE